MSDQLWHAYGGVDGDSYFVVVVGPIPAEVETRGGDNQPWDTPWFGEGPYTQEPCIADFLSSFDHEPSADERRHLVPEEWRDRYKDESGDTEVREESSEGVGELVIGGREHTALSIAVESRIEELSHLSEQLVIRGDSTRKVIACQDQIKALISAANALQLVSSVWTF